MTENPVPARFPRLTVDLGAVGSNARAVAAACDARGVGVVGVVKGAGGRLPEARAMAEGGCRSLASSRLAHLAALRGLGLPLGLLRAPGRSELARAVELADWSLQSDGAALGPLAAEASRAGRVHGVVLMFDLGDLREGWFDEDEFVAEAIRVERSLGSLRLEGIGTNLSCYGSILPGPENLGRLVAIARRIEGEIGRPLARVSGGATTSLPLMLRGGLPAGVNELRIGEAILCGQDLPHFHGVDLPGLRSDAMRLSAEVVEMRRKPSLPVGERFLDAFGRHPAYEDRGERLRLILAAGKRDFGTHEHLLPRDPRIHVIGSSSDHLICEADEPCPDLGYGSVLDFDLIYGAMLYLGENPHVQVAYA